MRITLCIVLFLSTCIPSLPVSAQDKAAAIERFARRYVDLGLLNGTLLVAEEGKVLFHRGFGYADREWKVPNATDTRFRIASVTKPFTALLIMQLVEEGKLSFDTTVSAILPYYRTDTGSKITIRHLLSNSSGIPNFTQRPGFMRTNLREPVEGATPFILQYCSGDLEFEPGSTFTYSNSGYFILGAVIEAVTGRPYAAALQERILKRAGMTASGVDSTGLLLPKRAFGYTRNLDGTFTPAPYWDPGWAFSAGAMYSTTEDLLRFVRAVSAGALIPRRRVEEMITPLFPAFGHSYGLGWMLARIPLPGRTDTLVLMRHRGDVYGTSAYLSHEPRKQQTVILLCNVGGAPVQEIVDGVYAILNHLPPRLPRKSIAEELYRITAAKGVQAAVDRYRQVRMTDSSAYALDEAELNVLGYTLLRERRIDAAVRIFELNVEAYPDAFNTHDSLGEALLARGDRDGAIRCYRKAVELNPNHVAGKRKLTELSVPSDTPHEPD